MNKLQSLKLNLPKSINTYSNEELEDIYEYLSSLNEIEKIAYNVAFNQLESSFNILKSNGFIKWKKNSK